jgi:hypothetical protein
MQHIDPASDISARIVAERLLVNRATRKVALDFLVDSIVKVHKQGVCAGTWSITLAANGQFIRMNVGVVEVFAIASNLAHIIVDFNKLSDTDASYLQTIGGEVYSSTPVYVRVPCSELWNFPADQFHVAIPIIQHAYNSLLEEAVTSVKWRTGYYKSHSPGVLEYLRQETGQYIPDPIYDLTCIIAYVQQQQLGIASSYTERQALQQQLKELQKELQRISKR